MLLLVLVAGLIYGPYLNRTISYDEAYTLRHYAFSPVYALLSYTLPNNHILNSFLIWIMTSLAGKSELVVRFPAFAAGLLSLAAVYHLTNRFFGQLAGLLSAAILMCHPVFILYAISARGYSLSILLTLLLITLVLHSGRPNRATTYSLIAICAGLILTLPSMAVLVAAVGAWALIKRRAVVPPIVVGTIVGGMFYLAAFSRGTFHDVGGGYYGLSTPAALLGEFVDLVFTSALAPGILLGLLAVVGAIGLARRRVSLGLLLVAVFVIPAVLVLVQWVVRGDVFFGRNYLFLLGPLALLAGYGCRMLFRRWSLGLVPICMALSVIAAPVAIPQEGTVLLMQRIQANLRPGETIVIGNDLNEPVWYYLGHQHQDWFTPDIEHGRVYFVETNYQLLSDLLTEYKLNRPGLRCQPAGAEWEPFQVKVCYLP